MKSECKRAGWCNRLIACALLAALASNTAFCKGKDENLLAKGALSLFIGAVTLWANTKFYTDFLPKQLETEYKKTESFAVKAAREKKISQYKFERDGLRAQLEASGAGRLADICEQNPKRFEEITRAHMTHQGLLEELQQTEMAMQANPLVLQQSNLPIYSAYTAGAILGGAVYVGLKQLCTYAFAEPMRPKLKKSPTGQGTGAIPAKEEAHKSSSKAGSLVWKAADALLLLTFATAGAVLAGKLATPAPETQNQRDARIKAHLKAANDRTRLLEATRKPPEFYDIFSPQQTEILGKFVEYNQGIKALESPGGQILTGQ